MKALRVSIMLACAGTAMAWAPNSRRATAALQPKSVADSVIAAEKSALDRWGRGDPQGYIETYSPDITYFDPFTEKRVDGIAGMKAMLAAITGKVHIDRYEMLNPRVQQSGDIAVLTFNLASHVRNPDGSPMIVRWNSTEVYRRMSGKWRIIHNHWSFTKPDLKQPPKP